MAVNIGSVIPIAATSETQTFPDDVALKFGTGGTASILYETADTNANALIVALPEGGATDVPVLVVGDASISNADLTFFNAITEPSIAVMDDDKSAYLLMGFYANDQPALRSANAITLMPSGDVDDYFTFSTVSDVPTITATGATNLAFGTEIIAPNFGQISGALTAGNANAFAFAWQNPHAYAIQVTELVVEVVTPGGTAGSVLDAGAAANATTTASDLIHDGDLNTAGYLKSMAWVKLAAKDGATDYITGQILTANAASLVGKYYISYRAV
jgi:hypothetical protein